MAAKKHHELASFLDEDKIITYKWLSKQMNLTALESKELLESYFKRNKTSGSLTAIYCLIGFEKKFPKNQRLILVRETELTTARSQFHAVTSQHVYSLQKAFPKNSNSIYMVDLEAEDRDHTFNVKENTDAPREKPQAIIQKTQPQIQNMPKLQEEKPESQQKQSQPKPLKEILVKPKLEIKTDVQNQGKKTNLIKIRNDKPKAVKITKQRTEPSLLKSSKIQSKKKPEPEVVKRKRIRVMSSSSSESEENDEENEESVLNSSPQKDFDSEDPIATSPKEPTEITLRQQQEVNQSFVDDDGYLVTTKVRKIVEEKVLTIKTATVKEKKVSQPAARGKKKPEQNNNKQATLMSYFKKS